ncbi:MAG: hypothetical protein WAM28_06760 [Chlamydiales bacterium]
MLKYKHRTLVILAGMVWLLVGIFLLTLGIRLILYTISHPPLIFYPRRFSLLTSLSGYFSSQYNGIVVVLSCCLFIGYLKGRFVLSKSVQRQVDRIFSLPNPAHLKYLYSKGYYILMGSMVCLGFLIRFFPIAPDTRGAVDVIIGSALINGSILYFRHSLPFTER